MKNFPTTIHDPELGDINWIFPDTSDVDAARMNFAVQKKIDVIEGNVTKPDESIDNLETIARERAKLEQDKNDLDKQIDTFNNILDE